MKKTRTAEPLAKAAHTPGPLAWQKFGDRWCLTGQYGLRPIILSATEGKLMLRDDKCDLLIPFDPAHPDARLIAAAPELLEALKEIEDIPPAKFSMDRLEHATRTIEKMTDIARAAIAKAEGR